MSMRSRIGARSAAPLRNASTRKKGWPEPSLLASPHPLTQLRVGLGCASPTLQASPPIGGEGRARGSRGSGFVVREAHGGGAGAVVGLDVDQRHHALVDLFLRAFEGRADVLRLFDIFAVGAEALGHDVVARVAEVAARLVALRVRGPAAVEADDAEERQFVPDRGVELHRVLPEGTV